MDCMDLWAIVPELILAATALLLVPLAAFARGRWLFLPPSIAAAGLAGALAASVPMLGWAPQAVFCDTYAVDGFGVVFKLLLLTGALLSLAMVVAHFRGTDKPPHAATALVFATLGAVLVASAIDLGLIVLFLQLLSMASYVLVALVRRDRAANEAVLKYFIYAAAALAIMAYGLTFLFGLTGSLDLRAIGAALGGADAVWVAVAFGLILVGYGFEVTMAPFHFWAPDVYSGATAPVTGFLSVVPKLAGFAALLRFLLTALPGGLAGWPTVIALLAALTMTWGNLAALRQRRLKRLLAYSSVAQAGYVLIAVAVAERVAGAGVAAAFYLAAYLFMNLGAFAVVGVLERHVGHDDVSAYRGLARRAPGLAAVLALSLLSLAGVPPLAGFFGKVLLLQVGLDGGLAWLVVVAVLNMVVALYYYLTPIVRMYFGEHGSQRAEPFRRRPLYSGVIVLSLLGILVGGVAPELLMRVVSNVAELLTF